MARMNEVRELVFPGFRFGSDTVAQAERLVRLGAGGFCLYRGTASGVEALTCRLQRRARTPLLFCGDYEDGLTAHAAGGTALPSNMGVAASGRTDLAREKGRITAVESRAVGVAWVFAPVLDLAGRADNPIVNIRAFGSKPGLAGRLGRAYLRGVRAGGALSCVKHFPGHGDTRKDSHLSLPTVSAPRSRLMSRELAPYRATLDLADSVMMGHLRVPALGGRADLPASLSRKAVGGLLRERLGFGRLVVSDALDMRAVSSRWRELDAAILAIRAGSDVLLVPADAEKLMRELPAAVEREGLVPEVRAALGRLRRAKAACLPLGDRGIGRRALGRVGCARHRRAAEKMAEACLAWAGRRPPPLPGRVAYMEARSGPRRGGAFVDELRSLGVDVRPSSSRADALVSGVFVGPRAYSGRITLAGAERRRVVRALRDAVRSITVSFGSPFVLEDLPGPALCAFSDSEEAQRAAARAVAGRLRVRGRMPVRLSRRRV